MADLLYFINENNFAFYLNIMPPNVYVECAEITSENAVPPTLQKYYITTDWL